MITIYLLFKLLRRLSRPFVRGRTRAGAGRHKTTTRTVYARSIPKPKTQEQLERDRRKAVSEYNRRIKADLEKRQAADDIIHLEQRKADLLKAYEQIPDANSEKIIKRRIAYDNAIRSTEKQIERAYMILHRTY